MRLAVTIYLLPLLNPVLVAEETATLDVVTGGRFILGVGLGYRQVEDRAFGVEPGERTRRMAEHLDVITRLWRGEPATLDRPYCRLEDARTGVRPLQQPRPPIWITAQSPDSVENAVRRGFNVLTGGFGVPIERMGEFRQLFDRVVAEVKPEQPLSVGVQRAVYVTHSESDARAAAEEARWNMRVTLSLRHHYERVERGRAIAVPAPKEPDVDDLLDRFLVIGTPDTVIRQIRRVQDVVGISHFNCSFWFGDLEHGRILRSMELFAKEVMPAFA
jgi:alkanesulfonate monooxygenase SsuD/methylene tetrahydromethanopterin reductase-like flavin-dependent oxidoreductase (luciferase family)